MNNQSMTCNIVILLGTLLLVLVAAGHPISSIASHDQGILASTLEEETWYTAIVVVRAVSGASYMDDREYIATMPALETDEEMRTFVAKHEPDHQQMEAVRNYVSSIFSKLEVSDRTQAAVLAIRYGVVDIQDL